MQVSTGELARAREVAGGVLEELGLDAYLFEVEPGDGQWEVRVECAVTGGWESCRLSAEKEYLLRGADDAVVHRVLVDSWGEALSACLRG